MYKDGEILSEFDQGPKARNEWGDGVTGGDRLIISDKGVESDTLHLAIHARHEDANDFTPIDSKNIPSASSTETTESCQ